MTTTLPTLPWERYYVQDIPYWDENLMEENNSEMGAFSNGFAGTGFLTYIHTYIHTYFYLFEQVKRKKYIYYKEILQIEQFTQL